MRRTFLQAHVLRRFCGPVSVFCQPGDSRHPTGHTHALGGRRRGPGRADEGRAANRLRRSAPYNDPHWYANIGYYCDDENHKAYAGNGKPDAGKLCLLDVRTAKMRSCWTPRAARSAIRRSITTARKCCSPTARRGTRLLPPLRNQRRRLRPAATHAGRSTTTSRPTFPTAGSFSSPRRCRAGSTAG